MIEVYLAVLLFGLGTYFNQKDSFKKTNTGKIKAKPGINMNTIDQQTLPVSTEQVSDTVKRLEAEYADTLDTNCRDIQNRDFSSLLDAKSKDLYKARKFSETGEKAEVESELHDGILKYNSPKKDHVRSSLTGSDIPLSMFTNSQTIGKDGGLGSDKINNTWAVPYFGSVAKQPMNVESFQNKLDVFTGNSQFNFHKRETKNFFVPNKNVSFVNGSPIQTQKLQSRIVKSNLKNNELPFEKTRVAPGVGQNYGSMGTGAFHQFQTGEIARPKTIDDLRSVSNPKITYSSPLVSGKGIYRRGSTPNLAKNRTSKTFPQTHANLLRTTGAFRKQQLNPNIIVKNTNRTTSKSVFGSAAPVSSKRTYTVSKYSPTFRNNYTNTGMRNIFKSNSWNAKSEQSDYGKRSFVAVPNERDVTQKRTHLANVMSAVKAVIAPLQDKLKNSKKELVIGNPNPEGYMGADMPKKQTVYDPNDKARTTVKETTLEYDHDGNIKGPNKMTVHDPNDVARTTIKETTIEYDHDGNIKGPNKITVYDPNDVARTTIKETTIHNKMNTVIKGATKVYVYDPNDVARTTIKETTSLNKHNGNLKEQVPSRPTDTNIQPLKTTLKETLIDNKHITNISYVRGDGKGYLSNEFYAPATLKQLTSDNEYEGNIYSSVYSTGGYLSNEYNAPATLKQFTSDFEYIGGGNSSSKAPASYGSAYNAITNSLREKVLRGRAPTQTGAKRFNGGREAVNVANKKQGINVPITQGLIISRVSQQPRDAQEERLTSYRTPLSNKNQNERINPSQLNVLKRNPYAMSFSRRFGANRGTSGYSSISDSE
tara:strand:- start:432 stop:2894 length:2463 start_codon:yes stop_codon:yes gene_type:complete